MRKLLKRVLIVLHEKLLADGLASLLSGEEDLMVINGGLSSADSVGAHLGEFQPEVLIMEKGVDLECLPTFLKLISDFPTLKIVVIETTNNRAHIYDKRELKIKKASDLISAIL